jgi:hypothetical protein|tara:strand:+ start:1158 stop:2120 length:963 start_codon:yes stop_codon:yes gene_type:complete
MAQLVQTNGDYTIKTGEGSKVLFDTGVGIGEVRITGNLIVEGDTLTVEAENLNVNDNVIELNYGETGDGVSLRFAGLQIDRGTLTPASFFFDEVDDTFNIAKGLDGTYNFNDSGLRVKKILTNSVTDQGDLTLIGTGAGVVKVLGTTTYEAQVTHDDDIPNKKYVDDAIRDNPTFQIVDNDTRVIVTDKDVSGALQYLIDNTGYSSLGESAISVIVDGSLAGQFFKNRVQLQDLEVLGNEITNNDTNGNISLRTQGTGKVVFNYGLQVEKIAVTPAYVNNSTILYHNDEELGQTGVFFTNNTRTGELVNRNRALLYSILF